MLACALAQSLCTFPQTSRPLLLRKSMYKDTDIELKGKTHKMCSLLSIIFIIYIVSLSSSSLVTPFSYFIWMS